jgi:beta-lactamase regulating signal transducer with metallopeptidase domain
VETVLQTALSNAVVASALALVAVLVGRFCRRPALAHGLWLLVLLKLVTPPLVPVPIDWPAPPEPQTAAAAPTAEPSDTSLSAEAAPDPDPEAVEERVFVLSEPDPEPAAPEPGLSSPAPAAPPAPLPWQTLVGGVWLTGSAGWFLLAAWRLLRFRRLLRFSAPAPESLRKMAERLARKMGLPACPRVCVLPGRVAPMLWAAGGRPLLLVPADLLAQLTREQQETLLAHELAHLRRRDHWVRALEFVAMGLYWWHPVVWYARRTLREAEEQCCDAWVVSLLPGAGKTYATALLETLDFLSDARPATPLLASGVGEVSDLKRRLTMIMCGNTPRALTWRGALAVLALGLLALPLLPTLAHAQTRETQDDLERQLAQARDELRRANDALNAQGDLEKARAQLLALQADLKMKQARLKQLEERIAALSAGKGERPGLAYRRPDEPKKEVIEIILRKVGDKWEVVPGKPGQPAFRAVDKEGIPNIVPINPRELPPGWRFSPVPPEKVAPEGRIDNLERQLKKIMLEIEMMRKEMKSRPEERHDPFAPVPAPR